MAYRVKFYRRLSLLIFIVFFLVVIYSGTGSLTLESFWISLSGARSGFGAHNQSDNKVSIVNLTDIVDDLYEQNWTCHRYFSDYGSGSDNVMRQGSNSASLTLYPPPCPVGDLANFRFLINRDLCGVSEVYMLVLVGSHPSHRDIRNVFRQTLGDPGIEDLPFKMAFFFGHIANASEQRLLEEEGVKYGDIIQGNFVDSYHNVTSRDLMGFRWAWLYCPQARLIMKVDDDVSVDVYSLIDAVERVYSQMSTTVGCFQMMVDTRVFRDGHYAVTKEEHPSEFYDTYCQGWMYMLTPQMAYNLDVASLKVPPYWMNDAYITGTLVKALGQSPLNLNVPYTIEAGQLRSSKYKWPPTYTVGPTGGDANVTLMFHRHYKIHAQMQNLPKFKWRTTTLQSISTT